MNKSLLSLIAALAISLTLAPSTADAKRLGGGKSSGMQRSGADTAAARPAAPAQANPAPATPATPAAAAPKRSWMGPLAGLAAGLGLAALFSHLGMGEAFGNIMMMILIGVVLMLVVGFIVRRMRAGTQPALAGAGAPIPWPTPQANDAVVQRSALAPVTASAAGSAVAANAGTLPAGFDAEGFARTAKMIFVRLQEANDRADLEDIRQFTTPEMFAAARLDLQDRGGVAQTTDVVRVDAEVLDAATEGTREVVSVRFHGLVREEREAAATQFDEVWHLAREAGEQAWRIAGIQQRA